MPTLKELTDKTNELISTNSTDENKIELTMDFLLDAIALGSGKAEFCRLNEYYSTINPRGAKDYGNYYLSY